MSISRLQQPLGVAPDEASVVNMNHLSPLLIFIILFGIVVLVTMCARLRRPRFCMERSVEVISNEQTPLERNVVEHLSYVSSAMKNVSKPILDIKQKTGLEMIATSALPCFSGQCSEGNKGSITTENFIGKSETNHQANLLSSRSTNEVSGTDNAEQDLSKVAVKMRELVELSHRLQAAAQVFDTYNIIAPSLKMGNEDNSAQSSQYLSFLLGNELLAVSLHTVQEVVEANRLIIESDRSRKIRKAINLRGSVVPVIDLSKHFGGEPIEVNRNTLILILVLNRGERAEMIGLLVDAISQILNIASSSIEPLLIRQVDTRSHYTIGTIRVDNRSIFLLDISLGLLASICSEPNSASRMLE